MLFTLVSGPALGGSLAGAWESADGRFRAVVYGPTDAPRVVLYGTVRVDGAQRRFVAPATRAQRVADGLWLELPPRRLFAGDGGPSALAGHRSELPPAGAEEAGTTWLLRPAGDALVLGCHPPASAACGLSDPVRLLPRGRTPSGAP